jgi:hypothetical protein
MSDDGQQTSAPDPKQSDASIGQSPFTKPKMEEIDKPPLLPWGRKKRAGKR